MRWIRRLALLVAILGSFFAFSMLFADPFSPCQGCPVPYVETQPFREGASAGLLVLVVGAIVTRFYAGRKLRRRLAYEAFPRPV